MMEAGNLQTRGSLSRALIPLLLGVLLLQLCPCTAIGAPDFPRLSGRVVDRAGMLDAAAEQRLEDLLKTLVDDLEGDLVDHLGDDRIDLARHDRGARRALRQVDLVQAALRAAREQAQVIADLGELAGHALEHT